MDQEPTIKNEQDFAQNKEAESSELETKGAEMLENPANNDFVVGLRAFIVWVKTLLAKKE